MMACNFRDKFLVFRDDATSYIELEIYQACLAGTSDFNVVRFDCTCDTQE